jgi:shikimate 5-dehydrogenase
MRRSARETRTRYRHAMTFADPSAETLSRLVSLAGRGVIVTGSGQGLGLAIAQRAVEAGAKVLIVDRDGERARQAAESLDAESFVGDVTDSAQVEEMMAVAAERSRTYMASSTTSASSRRDHRHRHVGRDVATHHRYRSLVGLSIARDRSPVRLIHRSAARSS